MRRVEVLWEDSRQVFQSWELIGDMGVPGTALRVLSVGYVYEEEDDLIVLIQNKGDDQIMGGIAIPRRSILTISEF